MNLRSWMLGPMHRHVSIRCIFPHFGLRDICGRNDLYVFMNTRSWRLWRGRWCFHIRRVFSHFRLFAAYRRNRLLPDWRSRFAHRRVYLWLALWWIVRLRGNRLIFFRCRSRLPGMSGLLVLWSRFRSGFPLRFRFRFRQLADGFFHQMAGLPRGVVGGIRDFAALVAILRLPILRCVAQLLPKLLKGSIRAAAECCLRCGFERFGCTLFQR